MVPDDLAQAVLSREDVVRYLQSSHGGSDGRERVFAYLEELKTTQRYPFYRALKHPLYPILRKIDRRVEHLDIVEAATRAGRVIYASNHKSHTDYLVEPVVLDDNGVRPPIIAAGINLFGGPLGLIHRHVTGAIPIRRNAKDPAYLVTLKAYVAELLRRHDLLFYPEGGRSYSGELKSPKTGLLHAALNFGNARADDRADGHLLRSRARRSHPGEAAREAEAAPVRARVRRDGALRRRLSFARIRHVRPADSARRLGAGVAPRRDGAGQADDRVDRQARQGAADLGHRDGHAAVGHPARSRSRAPRRLSRRCAPSARISASPAAARRSRRPPSPSEARGIIVYDRGRFRVRDRNVLRYYARAIEHLLTSGSARTH